MRPRSFAERIRLAGNAEYPAFDSRKHRLSGHAISVRLIQVGHDARPRERQATPRSEITDVDRRNRSRRLPDARHHAERPHAGEGLGERRTTDAVVGDIDAALAGEI